MIRKDNLISHCRRMMDRYKSSPAGVHIYFEHKIFLELLTGRDVNEMFDEDNKYKED